MNTFETMETKSSHSSAFDPMFRQELTDRGISDQQYPPQQPKNLNIIQDAIEKRRGSESPSVEEFYDYSRDVQACRNEASVRLLPFESFFGFKRMKDGHQSVSHEIWANLEPVGGYTSVRPKPYWGEGLQLSEIPRWIRDDLGRLVTPIEDGPAFINFTVELKGPRGSMDVAHHQSRHEGAICARSYYEYDTKVRGKGNESLGIAQAGSVQFNGNIVSADIYWPSEECHDEFGPKYHMTRVISHYVRTSNFEDFKRARREIRNFRDYFYDKREELRKNLQSLIHLPMTRSNSSIVPEDFNNQIMNSQVKATRSPTYVQALSEEIAASGNKVTLVKDTAIAHARNAQLRDHQNGQINACASETDQTAALVERQLYHELQATLKPDSTVKRSLKGTKLASVKKSKMKTRSGIAKRGGRS